MITHYPCDLLKSPANVIVHQANLYHTFGAGIAKQIKQVYPEAYEADLKTPKGDKAKLGTFSYAKTKDGKFVVNLYSQDGIGGKDRRTSYDAMVTGFEAIHKKLVRSDRKWILGIPYGIGAGLANGNWNIIEAIINSIFQESDLSVYICHLTKQ